MSSRTIRSLRDVIRESGQKKTSAFDTVAVVTNIENGVALVKIPGGEDETPVALTVNAKVGDSVQVRVSNGRAFLVGNSTAPPTDDTRAEEAAGAAQIANNNAAAAQTAATEAQESANAAAAAAEEAQTSANNAATAAANAQASATTANTAANNALTQLSTVENVVGTLNWISEHGTYAASTDTEVVVGKLYFTRTGAGTEADPYVYNVIVSPTGSPAENGYYELDSVDEAVSAYVSAHLALTDEGLFVVFDNSGYKVKITNDAVYIIDPSGNVVAVYSTYTQIGKTGEAHTVIDYHSMQIMDKSNNAFFRVSDLRDDTGIATLSASYVGDGSTRIFRLEPRALNTSYTVKVNDAAVTSGITKTTSGVTFSTAPASGAAISIEYTTTSSEAKALTFGQRIGGVGAMSVALGTSVTASGFHSYAEGDGARADAYCAHAEGYGTSASGYCSHAEGYGGEATGSWAHSEGYLTFATGSPSHAEGESTAASGGWSHAEGYETEASGSRSHAGGHGTVAKGSDQTAIGRFNKVDNDNKYAFIIGNGSHSGERSNAMAITWDGKLELNNKELFGSVAWRGNSSAVSLASGSAAALETITLATGKYLVMYGIQFANNANGYRRLYFQETSVSAITRFASTQNAVTGTLTNMNATCVYNVESQTEYALYAQQNSGSALDVYYYLRIVRLA